MAKRRTQMHRLQDLVRLHRQKRGARETARLLGMGPNTERQYREALSKAGLMEGEPDALPTLEELKAAVMAQRPPAALPPQQLSSLEAYSDKIKKLADKGLGPRAAFDRLRQEEPEFGGSYSAVKRLYRTIRRARGVQAQQVAIPVETGPGEIAQVAGPSGRIGPTRWARRWAATCGRSSTATTCSRSCGRCRPS